MKSILQGIQIYGFLHFQLSYKIRKNVRNFEMEQTAILIELPSVVNYSPLNMGIE